MDDNSRPVVFGPEQRVPEGHRAVTKRETDVPEELVERIAAVAKDRGWRIGAAESLTSGLLLQRLGAGPAASEWFAGGVVAYDTEVKFGVLDVSRGPVVTAMCAEQMARGVAELLRTEAAVAVTGVGGPGPEEGHPAGTVFVATWVEGEVASRRHDLTGEPASVVDRATWAALTALADAMLSRQQG
jgi:nicotinamide-nucleotide amidase